MGSKDGSRTTPPAFGDPFNATGPNDPVGDPRSPDFSEVVQLRIRVLELLQRLEARGIPGARLTGDPEEDGETILDLLAGKTMVNFNFATGKSGGGVSAVGARFERMVQDYLIEGIRDYLRFKYGA